MWNRDAQTLGRTDVKWNKISSFSFPKRWSSLFLVWSSLCVYSPYTMIYYVQFYKMFKQLRHCSFSVSSDLPNLLQSCIRVVRCHLNLVQCPIISIDLQESHSFNLLIIGLEEKRSPCKSSFCLTDALWRWPKQHLCEPRLAIPFI